MAPVSWVERNKMRRVERGIKLFGMVVAMFYRGRKKRRLKSENNRRQFNQNLTMHLYQEIKIKSRIEVFSFRKLRIKELWLHH